jgi:hypothetical protein
MAMMSLANISQGRAQSQRLVREGGMRVLLHCVSLALEASEAARGGGGGGEGGRGWSGGGVQRMVEEETMHYASMALYHLSCCSQTTEALIRHGAHQVLYVCMYAHAWCVCVCVWVCI